MPDKVAQFFQIYLIKDFIKVYHTFKKKRSNLIRPYVAPLNPDVGWIWADTVAVWV